MSSDEESSGQSGEQEEEEDQEEVAPFSEDDGDGDGDEDGGDAEPSAKKQKRSTPKKAGKKSKDPNRPKNALSAYMWFAKVNRPKVVEEFPGQGFKFYGAKLGERWRDLPDPDKKPYIEMSARDKRRFQEEMAAYVPSAEFAGRRKHKRAANEPKKPLSAYMIFSGQARKLMVEQDPKLKMPEISKKLSERWKMMSDEEKKPFLDQQVERKAQYLADKAAFESSKA